MKLSDLKALVAAIENNKSSEHPDPEVTFWLRTEVEDQVRADHPVRGTFVDCHVDHFEFQDGGVSQHRTPERDFSFPLALAT